MKIIESNLKHPYGFSSRHTTDMIVLHHAAAKVASAETVNQWHLANGWNGIGYHYYIRKDGSIYRGRPEWALGSHAKGSNDRSIGICCEGDYMIETMPDAQLAALQWLLRDITGRNGKLKIKRHMDVYPTDCPGVNFPWVAACNYETEDIEMSKQEIQKMIRAEIEAYFDEQEAKPASNYAVDAWDRATKAGITDGTAPRAFSTREQDIVLLDRCGLIGK